jgi:dienelactone hydrolase
MKHNHASDRNLLPAIFGRKHLVRRIGSLSIVVLGLACSPFAQRPAAQRNELARNKNLEEIEPAQRDGYTTVYYKSGRLNIEAYLYKPLKGEAPFPLVIYNHGSRAGNEQAEIPFTYVANVLVAEGYAVLVPERRGYGKSDGATYTEEVGSDRGDVMVRRFEEESDDVLAALDYLKTLSFVDPKRMAIMGWSHGGVATILTASRSHAFVAMIDQAGGALTWNNSPALRQKLTSAARNINIPSMCMDAENDATTEAAKTVCNAIRVDSSEKKTIIYPPFTPSKPTEHAPGHNIFSAAGMSIWQNDMLSFLRPRLALNRRFDRASPVAVREVQRIKRPQP